MTRRREVHTQIWNDSCDFWLAPISLTEAIVVLWRHSSCNHHIEAVDLGQERHTHCDPALKDTAQWVRSRCSLSRGLTKELNNITRSVVKFSSTWNDRIRRHRFRPNWHGWLGVKINYLTPAVCFGTVNENMSSYVRTMTGNNYARWPFHMFTLII